VALEAYDATFASVCSRRNYRQWVQQIEGARRAERREACRGLEALASPPGFAVLVPAGPDAQAELHATLESLRAQSWPHWQAVVFGPGGDEQEAARGHGVGRDGRVVFVQTAAASSLARQRAALQAVAGDRVLVLAPGDRLAPDALGILAGAAAERPEAALIYADEDRLDPEGLRHDPHLKPRWNPDLLLSTPYVGRPALWRREALEAIDRALDGTDTDGDALDHARILGLLAADGAAVAHVPEVLVHRGPAADDRPWAPADTVRAALTGQGRAAQVTAGRLPGTVRVRWPLPDPAPTVSLVMPTRDRVDVLRPCVDAILRRTEYPDYELLILDNQSRCPETLGYLDAVARRDPRVRVLRWDHPFNYSAINNYGVAHARGALVALVNNDVEPLDGGWLEELVRHALRPDIGCVGAKLHYPDGTVQHGGVILGLGGVAGHAHRYFPREDPGFMGRLQVVQNLSAVTGACLVVRRALYEQVGGLNARDLPVAYNDVDFCLRVREAGYRNLWTPYAELVHHESASRGTDDTPAKRRRAERELAWMRRRWGPLLDDDPAYNPNLTRVHEDFSLG
jgi:GT2 family glycosyltransferase